MNRLAIFAGYDKHNVIDDYVVYYIKELKKIADIIYVSDCDMLDDELKKISDYCLHIINGRHEEYDFGSYKRGYLYVKENKILENYDYLIFCNDSMYGPFFNLLNIFEEMEDNANTDVWGMYLYGLAKIAPHPKHLQSYFISMHKRVFSTEWFYNFINSVEYLEDKEEIIKRYEVGLGNLLFSKNLNIKWKFSDTEEYLSMPHTQPELLINSGFPFLKKMIINDSEAWNFSLSIFTNILLKIKDNYDINLILNNLSRVNNIKYLYSSSIKEDYKLIQNNNILLEEKINKMKLKIGWFSLFNIYNNSNTLKITIFGLNFTLKTNIEDIKRKVKIIPIKKLRDFIINKFI